MVHIATNVSPRCGVVRVVSDLGVVLFDPRVNVWDVPEIWHDNILFTTFLLNSITCFLMCLRKALVDQHPISMIMNTGHSPRYIAMAAPNLTKCVPTTSFLMPSFISPMAPTAFLNAFICVDITCLRCPFTMTVKMGES